MSSTAQSFFVRIATGESFPVAEPVSWCLENAEAPLLAAARERLLASNARNDGERIVNVVLRRCGLNLIEVHANRVTIHYWTNLADVRPFFKRQDLARHDVQVAQVRRKNGLITLVPGSEFLYGDRLGSHAANEYHDRFERRHEPQPDDRTASPGGDSSYSWEGVREGCIPWAVLKSVWRREAPRACPNCERPLAVWSFTWRHRTLLSMHGHIARRCFGCHCDFRESTSDLWPWLVATLDPDMLPSWQNDGVRKIDLRPRWPAPPRNLYDLNNLPPNLTLDELMRIMM